MKLIFLFLNFVAFAGPTGVTVDENVDGKPRCAIRVNYDGKSGLSGRGSNISDFEYMSKQPGGLQVLKEISSDLNTEMIKALLAQNKPLTSLGVTAAKGSKGCDALKEMARRLDERAKKKEWPEEKMEDLMVGSLMRAKIPKDVPSSPNSPSSGAPAPAGAKR